MHENLRVESQTLFEPWQIGADYIRFKSNAKHTGLRFGQWFLADHHIEGHSILFYETDDKKAKEYIMRMTR